MAPRRRSIAFFLVLSVVIGFAAAYGALRFFSGNPFPWAFSLPWQDMEELLETQVIAAIAVDVRLEPSEGYLAGEATLAVTHPGGDGRQVVLLLNPGLEVEGVTCDGARAGWRREGERLVISLPDGKGACEVVVAYGGYLTAANSSTLLVGPDVLVADKLQWWYPLDLKNFTRFSARVQAPEGVEVACGGASGEVEPAGDGQVLRWEEARPVLAVGLAAGRFEKRTRLQGGVRCTVYTHGASEEQTGEWLSALGDAYNYYTTLLGPDGFQQVNLVVTSGMKGIEQIGGPTLVASPASLEDPELAFAALAGRVAQNWWGDTVSGRWFTTRPEAGEWLVSGMSEYFGWQALRQVKGRRSYLRFMEQAHYPPAPPTPLKLANLEGRLQGGSAMNENALRVRGAYVAAALGQYTGNEAFMRACKNFMAVHRHTTVSYSALLHEMTLASEKPLEELGRVWFDRPGAFDYGISSVAVEGNAAHVSIENAGDIPSFVPLTLGVITADGYQVQAVDPGAQGKSVRFSIDGPLKRVVLDPEFDLGDMKRANNVWPQTQWPLALDVSQNGRIAMLVQTEWGGEGARRILLFSLADKAAGDSIAPGEGMLGGFQWDPDGQQLALLGATPGVWRREGWTAPHGDAVFLDWQAGQPVYWRDGAIGVANPSGGGGAQAEPPVPLPRPMSGLASIHPRTRAVAYVTDTQVLAVWDPATQRLTPLRDGTHAVGGLRWRGDTERLLYFDAGGALLSLDVASGAEEVLLDRNYVVRHARLSHTGGRVAWVDPAGLLRAFTPGGGEAVYISLPGEVVDFAWEGEDAIIAIVAAVPRRLPMRFHAEYTLWRVPASTWTGVQLPYDPAQFAAAARALPVERLE